MRCPQCGFFNLPGLSACARCGSRLESGGVSLADVTPPRARDRARRTRKFGYWWNGIRERLGSAAGRATSGVRSMFHGTFGEAIDVLPAWNYLVPGWAQWKLNRPLRAKVFFFLWGSLGLYGCLFVGLPLAASALGLAVGVHISSILDLFVGEVEGVARRLVVVPATAALVLSLIYAPAGWLIHEAVVPIQMPEGYGPLRAGDVAIATRGAKFNPGDVVLIRIPPRHYEWFSSDVVATVLGREGDVVKRKSGEITVNGVAVPIRAPDQIDTLEAEFERHVERGNVLVVTSERRVQLNGNLGVLRGNYSLQQIPLGRVFGRVVYINAPWSRREWIAAVEPRR